MTVLLKELFYTQKDFRAPKLPHTSEICIFSNHKLAMKAKRKVEESYRHRGPFYLWEERDAADQH